MGILDELKESANKAFDKAKVVGEKAIEKGKDLAQQGKLGMEILTIENRIKDLKSELVDIAIEKDLFKDNEEINNKLNEIKDLIDQKANKKIEMELLK